MGRQALGLGPLSAQRQAFTSLHWCSGTCPGGVSTGPGPVQETLALTLEPAPWLPGTTPGSAEIADTEGGSYLCGWEAAQGRGGQCGHRKGQRSSLEDRVAREAPRRQVSIKMEIGQAGKGNSMEEAR